MKMAALNPLVILVRPRIYIGEDISIGPGKIDLFRQVGSTRSIAAAARALGVPYKRAWLLIDSLQQGFGHPVVETATGGKGGGGASLTPLGHRLIACYDALEQRLNAEAAVELEAIRSLVN